MTVGRIGINDASTFPGFCESHELEFRRFETMLRVKDNGDYLLQVFRTVCREIAIKEHFIRHLTATFAEFGRRRAEWAKRRMEQALRKHFCLSRDFAVGDFEITVDDIHAKGVERVDSLKRDLGKFQEMFYDPFVEALRTGMVDFTLFQHSLIPRLPVALAGRGNFFVGGGQTKTQKEVFAVINVLPTKDGSEVFAAVPVEAEEALRAYMHNFVESTDVDSGVIRMIESWMLNGSDHWFLSPSAWTSLTQEQRKGAIESIASIKLNIGAKPSVSVLDSARIR